MHKVMVAYGALGSTLPCWCQSQNLVEVVYFLLIAPET